MVNDFKKHTLSGLDEGLRVRHIANFPLIKCRADEDIEEAFRRPEYKDFDQLPITEGSRIIGIAERFNPKVRRPLDDSVLVAADNRLSHFIHTVHEQSYRLVVDGTAITGIVTWSDLLKDDHNRWLELLDDEGRAKILGGYANWNATILCCQYLSLPTWGTKRKFSGRCYPIEVILRTIFRIWCLSKQCGARKGHDTERCRPDSVCRTD